MSAEKHILTEYLLRLADNSLIIGHRLSEWCGFGPVLEQDIAMITIHWIDNKLPNPDLGPTIIHA